MDGDNRDERTWAMACHLAAFAGYVIPFGHVIGPLVVWLIKREELPLVRDQGREALNFQISITIYAAVSVLLVFVVIGVPMLIAVGLFNIVMIIIASLAANSGQAYRYPLCLRLVR